MVKIADICKNIGNYAVCIFLSSAIFASTVQKACDFPCFVGAWDLHIVEARLEEQDIASIAMPKKTMPLHLIE